MHALESYALGSGSKISKPFILEKYFPASLDKYITIDCDARSPSKHYDFWQEVVDIIGPVLAKNNISIAQIGTKEAPDIMGAYSAKGQTSFNQTSYLIRNSLLHVGPDNICVDIASHHKKKIVAIYGNCMSSHFSPYWSDKNEISLIEPKRKNKPCYAHEEHPKSINTISPKDIAVEICRHLKIDFDFPYTYSYIGDKYHEPKINLVPDVPISVYGQLPKLPISIRADLAFNEQAVAETLKHGKFQIVTNKPFSPQLLSTFRNRIANMIYLIEENNEPNFVRFLMNNAIPYTMVSFLTDEQLNPAKLEYMDFGAIVRQTKLTKESILEKCETKPTHYKSNKFVLAGGKIYPSQPAWKRDVNIESFSRDARLIIDDSALWEESDNYCYLSK